MLLVFCFMLQSIGGIAAGLMFDADNAVHMLEMVCQGASVRPVFWVLIWGAGVIGIKTSRGTLALVLSRPVTNSTLVVSSWFAIWVAAVATNLIYLSLHMIQILVTLPAAFDAAELGVQIVTSSLTCAVASAVLVCFSTLVTGVKDLGLFFLLYLLAQIMSSSSAIPVTDIKETIWRQLCRIAVDCMSTLSDAFVFCINPDIPMTASVLFSWNLVVSLIGIAAVVLCSLSVGIYRLNTMELSYAAD
jgi:ABC-type transport system involved in multi-copper enzyme maturation permease subunit